MVARKARRLWVIAGLLLYPGTLTAYSADPSGLWRSESGKSRYQIRRCGPGICVQIVWIIEGPEVRDENNPDPAKRNRRVMGIDIVTDAKPDGKDRWAGNIYNFKNGKTYAGWAQMISANQLQMTGCLLGSLLCLPQKLFRIK